MMTAEHRYTSDWGRRLAAQIAESEAKGEANSVLAVLSMRGVEVSDDAHAVITSCKDHDQLLEWLRRAMTAERIEDLGGALDA